MKMFTLNALVYLIISFVGFASGFSFAYGRDVTATVFLMVMSVTFCLWAAYIDSRPRR